MLSLDCKLLTAFLRKMMMINLRLRLILKSLLTEKIRLKNIDFKVETLHTHNLYSHRFLFKKKCNS